MRTTPRLRRFFRRLGIIHVVVTGRRLCGFIGPGIRMNANRAVARPARPPLKGNKSGERGLSSIAHEKITRRADRPLTKHERCLLWRRCAPFRAVHNWRGGFFFFGARRDTYVCEIRGEREVRFVPFM